MKRLIGIADTCADEVAGVGINYSNALLQAGYLPVVIPYSTDAALLRQILSRLDGLLLPGGGSDVDPALYDAIPQPWNGPVVARRDSFEYMLLHAAVSLELPVVGICRGIQVINVYFGGTLYQDLAEEWEDSMPAAEDSMPDQAALDSIPNQAGMDSMPGKVMENAIPLLQHQRPDKLWEGVHDITILPHSHLHQLIGQDCVSVNSTHHQAVRDLAPEFVCTAKSPDGVIEAIESTVHPILAVQFHPERLGALGAKVLHFFG